jgi:hypothetical protein
MADQKKYDLPQAHRRPHVKAEQILCLEGEEGREIIKSEVQILLVVHKETFTRLGDM